MKKTLLALVAVLALTFTASAADFSGKWVRDPAAAPAGGGGGRGGGGGGTYEFKVAGATLTGTITQAGRGGGEPVVLKMDEGKVTGDTFSFSVMRPGRGGDPMKVAYTGKVVSADKLELTSEGRGGPMVTPLVKAP